MSGHTPGPWWIDETAGMDSDEIIIFGPRKGCQYNRRKNVWEMAKIDNGCFWDNPKTKAEDWANAYLIAAAPELLAALERAVGQLSSDCPGTIQQARAAIAKAEGQ